MGDGWRDRMTSARRSRRLGALSAAVAAGGLVTALGVSPADSRPGLKAAAAAVAPGPGRADKVLFFASDGLRQDKVADYVDDGALPGFGKLLRSGARASGGGMLP